LASSEFTFGTFRSFDGTELAYQLRGSGPGTPVVLSNGLGGDYRAWKHIFDRFDGERPFVTWDYRGLYRSAPPKTPGTLSPPFHALDLRALLDTLGWRQVILVGWSMGVQVNFEAWRRFPERIGGIAVVNGVSGKPFDTVYGTRLLRYVIPSAIKQMRRNARTVGKLTGWATAWRGLLPIMVKLGFVGPTIDMQLFSEFARTFSSLDFDLYGATLMALGKHDATDVLPTVTVPLRIVTGDRDMLTPLETARKMQKTVASATLRVLPGGTHYTPVEYPHEVCAELETLFVEVDRRVDGRGRAQA